MDRVDLGVLDVEGVRVLRGAEAVEAGFKASRRTGRTHLGSAEGRDKMHRAATEAAQQTDSMKMFLMGVEGGKPAAGKAPAKAKAAAPAKGKKAG